MSETDERSVRAYVEFLGSDSVREKYSNRINDAISSGKLRVIVNLNDLRQFGFSDLANGIIRRPREEMLLFQKAMNDFARSMDPTNEKVSLEVGFEGSLGSNAVSPRGLLSSLLNNLVDVEGIVTKCSNVTPKLLQSYHFCPATGSYSSREYRDATSLDIGITLNGRKRLQTSSVIPSKDTDGNDLEMEYGLCKYKDYQTLSLQEMPERARVGQLPRSVEVILENDLVDRVKAGDRVKCIGVYHPVVGATSGQISGVFPTVLLCNNVSILGKDIGKITFSPDDTKNIREVGRRRDILEVLARSLCPSIFGHEFIKKALVLQLLGGIERNLENGTHLRGDINVLLVGDPSTAKSQLLRSILDIAPLAISTTGRGSSGVGLTAAVTSDAETGERRLEAGAMVLADRGVVCVDEFDKMSENDRVAIHEVMEQQTVTIAKAGIHASLNARCSVLAAANPVYGQYDRSRRPQENVGLPDSLLSRFDLLFLVLDQLDPEVDRKLSEHVIRSHQYRRPGSGMEPEPLQAGSSLAQSLQEKEEEEQPGTTTTSTVYLRGGSSSLTSDRATTTTTLTRRGSSQGPLAGSMALLEEEEEDVFSKEFLRKYLHYAKQRYQPTLSEEAMETLAANYAQMRAKQSRKNLPVTARSLETLIRLSTAAAKARLSAVVEDHDAEVALELLNFVMFHEVGSSSSSNGIPSNNSNSHSNSRSSHKNAMSGVNKGDPLTPLASQRNKRKKWKEDEEDDEEDDEEEDDDVEDEETEVEEEDGEEGKEKTRKSKSIENLRSRRNRSESNPVTKKQKKQQSKNQDTGDDDDDDDDGGDDEKEMEGKNRKNNGFDDDEDDDDKVGSDRNISFDRESSRYSMVMEKIVKLFAQYDDEYQPLPLSNVLLRLNEAVVNNARFKRRELIAIVKDLETQNKLMYRDEEDLIYQV